MVGNLRAIIAHVGIDERSMFVDIGCGGGIVCLAAAALGFRSSFGIEYMELAVEVRNIYIIMILNLISGA
jgi:predicted RNA methylase